MNENSNGFKSKKASAFIKLHLPPYVRKRTAVVPLADIPGALFCRKKQKTAMTVTAFFKPWLIPRVTAVTAFNLAS
jgi:hypothetical protein